MESAPMFNSVEDECRYWKERAKLYHKEWTDVKQEYDEYVEQSRQMEAEMDVTLDQKQCIIKDLRAKLTSLEKENESLKLKLDSHTIDYANVEKQFESVKIERDSMREYLRQLEQKNDDLERAHRILNESIVDFERMLDKAYEKNALLEMEVDEKEVLQEKLQRLMDETRDLKQELNVKSRFSANGATNNSISNGVLNNGDALVHDATTTSTNTIPTNTTINNFNNSTTPAATNNINDYNQQHTLKRKPFPDPDNLINGNAMTASSRTTALNIVADMLRKLNLDKALLCPECEKFRCVCERTYSPSAADRAQSGQGQSVAANNNTVVRTFANTFGGSSHAVNTSTGAASATPTATCTIEPSREAPGAAVSGSTLSRSSSRSFSNLNFGTNIFKRFAERMSGNAGLLTTPTTIPIPIATPTTFTDTVSTRTITSTTTTQTDAF